MKKKKNINRKVIPFVDLKSSTEKVVVEYLSRVKAFLKKRDFILSQETSSFEKSWADFVGSKFSLGVSNGSDAIYLALLAIGIGPGDEVITSGNAYNASVVAIIRSGATPRFADIDCDTLTIDPAKVTALIKSNTKAILVVHLFGAPSDMAAIKGIAKQNKLFIVEDCAQAHGAMLNDKSLGLWGDLACWSFYPTKNLGAFGEAGAVTTDNEALYSRMQVIRNLGQVSKNNHQLLGYNLRPDSLQMIALSLKLKNLKTEISFRRRAADYYDKLIGDMDLPIKLPAILNNGSSSRHLYVLRVVTKDRDEVVSKLEKLGIQTAVHYPIPVYNQPFFIQLFGNKHDACPNTDQVAKEIVSLPFFIGITHGQQLRVIKSLAKSLS